VDGKLELNAYTKVVFFFEPFLLKVIENKECIQINVGIIVNIACQTSAPPASANLAMVVFQGRGMGGL